MKNNAVEFTLENEEEIKKGIVDGSINFKRVIKPTKEIAFAFDMKNKAEVDLAYSIKALFDKMSEERDNEEFLKRANETIRKYITRNFAYINTKNVVSMIPILHIETGALGVVIYEFPITAYEGLSYTLEYDNENTHIVLDGDNEVKYDTSVFYDLLNNKEVQ